MGRPVEVWQNLMGDGPEGGGNGGERYHPEVALVRSPPRVSSHTAPYYMCHGLHPGAKRLV